MSDAEIFGNFGRDRNAMFVESINMILKIWESSPPYNLKGQFWDISVEKTMIPEIGQGIVLKPYQKPHPPIVGTVVAPNLIVEFEDDAVANFLLRPVADTSTFEAVPDVPAGP
jgi:alkanesulfonate monooxygenase SsuD/methylene tetrahydromethanopterin reductase-like flavin-dependent oxidoreductase (luciferase family)